MKPSQVTKWDFVEKDIEEAKKKNKAKTYAQGLEEAKSWFHSDRVFPVYGEDSDEEEEEEEEEEETEKSQKSEKREKNEKGNKRDTKEKVTKEKEELKPVNEKKRKSVTKDVDIEAPVAKKPRGRQQTGVIEGGTGHDEMAISSDEDAPYKVPFANIKKARRVRVMRKLGLYPPEGSLFKATAHV